MIKKDIFNRDVKAQFKASAKDKIYRFVMADGMMKGAVVHATRMVNEMRANHQTGPLETLILGQAYVAVSLICSGLKGKKDRVSMVIECSGPIKGLDVEANGQGEVRGSLKTPQIEVDNPAEIDGLAKLFGAGFLTVTQYLEKSDAPYAGQVALQYGSIAEDLAHYYTVSEQIPSGFILSVFFDDHQEVKGAGGIFLQALPGADIELVAEAEKMMLAIGSLGELFAKGQTPEDIIQQTFSTLKPKVLESSRVEFFCRCSKDGMVGYLLGLPREDKKDILKNGPYPLVIRCHHCNSAYEFAKEDLQILAD
ncbi:MAG: Hsp33 family molecular chaperone HslO [Proteobacteria bacterium]|nr:Hsp33 family molecular chaperone HslO [Pseudomonadota bacterium]MBU1641627.1 Hsp33 family molecular chaperone HslO [Pseudomonadota bacterium]